MGFVRKKYNWQFNSFIKLSGAFKGKIYYYNREAGYLIDSIGTKIKIGEDLDGVKEKNLSLYVADLFESYYEIVDKFNRDCRLDKTEDIIWS